MNSIIIAIRLNVIFNRLKIGLNDINNKKKINYILTKTIAEIIKDNKSYLSENDKLYLLRNLTLLKYKIEDNDNTVTSSLVELIPCYLHDDFDELPESVKNVTNYVFL